MASGTPYQWSVLKALFLSDPRISLKDLSREHSGLESRPAYTTLRGVASKDGWIETRDRIYESRKKELALQGISNPESSSEFANPLSADKLALLEEALSRPAIVEDDDGYRLLDLPEDLRDRYSRAITDPHLMDMRRDIALMSSLITGCTRRMQSRDPSAKMWNDIKTHAKRLIRAKRDGDEAVALQSLSQMLELISKGNPEIELQEELIRLLEARSRLIMAEGKRLNLLKQYMSREDILGLARQFAEVVKAKVSDPVLLKNIGTEFARIRTSLNENS
jgi:hypothetical protein